MLVMSCNTMFLPALNTVQNDLHTSTAMVALCLTVYTAGAGVQPLVMGPLSDVIGRRKPMMVGSHKRLRLPRLIRDVDGVGYVFCVEYARRRAGCARAIHPGIYLGRASTQH